MFSAQVVYRQQHEMLVYKIVHPCAVPFDKKTGRAAGCRQK